MLTFDLPTGPSSDSEENLRDYDSTFTAEYTFYNPSDDTITAQLLFPIGTWPEYFPRPEGVSDQAIYDNLEQFDVTVDGHSIDKEIRHSLYRWNFRLDEQMAQLRDDYRTDTFLTPEMPVTHYRFRYSGAFEDEGINACIRFPVTDLEECLVYFHDQDCFVTDDNGICYPGFRPMDNHGTVNVYTFGEAPAFLPQWELLGDQGQPMEGEVTLEDSETVPLEELIFRDWTEGSGISKVDWYNSGIQWLLDEGSNSLCPGLLDPFRLGTLDEFLMCWYSYELTLEPGQELVNTVMAPAFPDVCSLDKGMIYRYTYLLSPAKTWSKFGALDIRIHSPLYLLESSLERWELDEQGSEQYQSEALEGWEEDESGCSLHLDGLPEGELVFDLSTSLDPYPAHENIPGIKEPDPAPPELSPSEWIFWLQTVIYLIRTVLIWVNLLALPPAAIVGLVCLVRKKKKNKRP